MRFLIWGHKGWIGQQVLAYLKKFHSNIEIFLSEKRAHILSDVETEFKLIRPTHVFSFIGRTHGEIDGKLYPTIDYLEQPNKIKENVQDNLFAPIGLAILCKKYEIHLTYIGTGCIFEYDDQHPFGQEKNGFTEDSLPNFFGSSYSVVKGYTDQLMHLMNKNVLNCRIRMPITASNNSRNFITKIVNYKNICSIPNSMTVLPSLIPIIIDMAIKNVTGTVNVVNPGLISHNEILEMYREIVDPNFTWQNFSLEEQAKILASGRSNNYLDTTLIESMYPNLPHIREAVRETLINMKIE